MQEYFSPGIFLNIVLNVIDKSANSAIICVIDRN